MLKHYGIDPFNGNYGMEEVFNIVYSDALSGSATETSLDAYSALLRMYQDAIGYTTNQLTGTSQAGVGALLRHFVRQGHQDFTFITFNQDLVIERAIDAAKATRRYSHIGWDISTTYQVSFAGDRVLSSSSSRTFHAERSEPAHSIKVLKLHGSLNWVYRVRSSEDVRNVLRTNRHDLLLMNEKAVVNNLVDTVGRRQMALLPFIVPPVYEKSSHIRELVQPAWAAARQALTGARELIIFGYSCPAADQAARNMLKSSFHRNRPLSHVHVIDPTPATASRLGELLDAPVLTRYKGVREFVSHHQSA